MPGVGINWIFDSDVSITFLSRDVTYYQVFVRVYFCNVPETKDNWSAFRKVGLVGTSKLSVVIPTLTPFPKRDFISVSEV